MLHDQTYATVIHDYSTVTDNLGVENNVYDNVMCRMIIPILQMYSTLVSKDLSTEVNTYGNLLGHMIIAPHNRKQLYIGLVVKSYFRNVHGFCVTYWGYMIIIMSQIFMIMS